MTNVDRVFDGMVDIVSWREVGQKYTVDLEYGDGHVETWVLTRGEFNK